jgi:hypothetical protein
VIASGSRGRRSLVLGVVSFAPIGLCGSAMLILLVGFMRMSEYGDVAGAAAAVLIMMLGAAASLVALIALLVDAFTSPRVAGDARLVWALVLLFGNVLGYPIYWYVVHWRRPALVSGAC